MDPLSSLTIGGLLKKCAGPFLKAHVLPVFNALIAGKVKDSLFSRGITSKVKLHLDEAIDKAFPYKDFTTEYHCEQERKLAIQNLKAYLFDDDTLELTLEQQEILNEWVKRMMDDPDCIQLIEALKNEGRYSTLQQMLENLPDKVVKPVEKLLEDKEKVDAARHDETMARLDQFGEVLHAGDKSEIKVDEKELIEQIINKFKETRDSHPSMQLMEISDKLFADGLTTRMKIKAKDEWSGKTKSMGAILKDSWKREKNHIMIVGEGGIGKTVTLLTIPSGFSKKQGAIQIPAIYIPLYELKSSDSDPIAEFIKGHILNRSQAKLDALFGLLDKTWDGRPRLLLLVDGFNEIPVDERRAIGRNIDVWAEFSGIQVITSSRFDTSTYFFNRTKYYKVELQPLSKESVVQYMEQADISYPDDPAIGRLISTPLMLNLFLETRIVIDRRKQNDEEDSLLFKEDNTAGAIIWNYLQCEVWNAVTQSGNDDRVVNACIVATEFIAPFMAEKMYDSGLFTLSEDDFDATLEKAKSFLRIAENGFLPKRIRNSWLRASFSETDIKKELKELLTKRLHILVNRDGRFKFMHQNFRDALAAIHLVNASYLVDENTLPKEWKSPIDYFVMNYAADLAQEKDADRLWKQNQMEKAEKEATINMIELQKRKREFDFSELDFSGLDLSSISLFPYRVPGTSTLLLPRNSCLNKDLQVSNKTFYSEGHTHKINVLVTSPDGKRCVSGSSDRTLRVWDIESGQCLRTLEGHKSCVLSVSLSPDGKHFVSGSGDKTLRIWDIETGKCLRVLKGHNEGIFTVSLTSDGKRCISGSGDKTLRVWDTESGQCLRTLEGHKNSITTLSITPDGKHCISGSKDCTLRVWNIENGICLKVLKGHTSPIRYLSVSPDGKCCVSGSGDKTLRVWYIETGKCLRILEGHTGGIRCLSLTPDGKRCVSGSDDKTLRVWDIETGVCLTVLEEHSGSILDFSITPDGKHCISGSGDKTLRVWDIEAGKCLRILEGHTDGIRCLSLTPDGKRCISGSNDKTLRIWDVESSVCLRAMESNQSGIYALSLTPDGKRCISGSNDKTLRIWDIETGVCLKVLDGHKSRILALSLSPDGKRCVSGSEDKTLRVWDIEAGVCLRILEGHTDGINSLSFTPDGKYCVSGSKDSTLRVWDIENGVCLKVLKGHTGGINSLSLTPDGKRCVSGSSFRTLRVWNIKTGACLKVLKGHKSGILTLSITPDGKRCISGSGDKTLRVWDIKTGKCLRILKGHEGKVFTLSLTPDLKHCISGSKDCTLRVWDIETGVCLKVLKGHLRRIYSLSLTPDGKRCVSVYRDGTLRVWDIETGVCLRVLNGHKSGVFAISLTQDGMRCVSGSSDSTLRIWDIETDKCLRVLNGARDGINKRHVSFDGARCDNSAGETIKIKDMEKSEHFSDITISILPLFLKDVNFAQASVPQDLKETLWQNGASFDDNSLLESNRTGPVL
ncbi:MAG: hypothetical protein IKM75_00695 [Bacteroidales bacterium]|nr:hypothetical protein [Bacteroidales bacterium]